MTNNSGTEKWWVNHKHLSTTITPDNLSGLMDVWKSWDNQGHRLYFRGEGGCLDQFIKPYPLQPNLLRKDTYIRLLDKWNVKTPCDLERKIFDRYKRYSAHLIEANTAFAGRTLEELELLCLSQHFGLPTRLLDWSMNPNVALYFSLVGEGQFSKQAPCRLWVMVLKKESERIERTIHLENNTENKDHKENVITLNVLNTPDRDQRAIFKKAPYIVVPLVFTQRIAAQSGRFVYCPHLKNEKDRLDKCITRHPYSFKQNGTANSNGTKKSNGIFRLPTQAWRLSEQTGEYEKEKPTAKNSPDVPWERLICYPVSHGFDGNSSHKESLLETLAFNEYHSGRLFPDLSGWAKYISLGRK